MLRQSTSSTGLIHPFALQTQFFHQSAMVLHRQHHMPELHQAAYTEAEVPSPPVAQPVLLAQGVKELATLHLAKWLARRGRLLRGLRRLGGHASLGCVRSNGRHRHLHVEQLGLADLAAWHKGGR
eukprot:366578-Chlamydomonas_euryale.AAC.4